MSNVIKLKRGSGSDPSASDLVVGEVALRTDLGKLFTKKDDNSVVEISGGVEDGDITTNKIANDAVTYDKIQNVSATNRILGRDSSGAGSIEEITPANLRSMLNVEDGATADQTASDILSLLSDQNIATSGSLTIGTDIIHSGDTDTKISFTTDQVAIDTGGTSRLTISASAIQLSLNTTVAGTFRMSHTNGNFAVNNAAGSDVFTVNSASGNVSTSGTVDGRDVAADGTKLDGIESGATADQTKSDIDALGIAASTAATLATARTIAGVSFDGSANISLNNNAITNGAGYITATLTNEEVQDIVGGMLTGNTETGITVTYQDSDGTIDFVVGTLNQDTTGNAATATALETARNIGGVSFDGSANINLPGVNTSGNQDTSGNAATATAFSVTSNNTTDETVYILFADGNSGTQGAEVDTALVYNPSTNVLTAGTFSGSGASLTSLPAGNLTGTLPAIDGSNLTGISAGATGGGSDEIFYENGQTVTTNYTITNGKNAMSAGPITINSGVTVTVGSGETLTIV